MSSRIWLRSELSDKDDTWLDERGAGIRGLRLAVMDREGHGVQALGAESMASTVSLEW